MRYFKKILSLSMVLVIFMTLLSACRRPPSNDYPNGDITIIVPFAAGGNSDIACRLMGAELGESLGVDVIIDNRSGGGSIIGQAYGAASRADGYTLTAITSSLVSNVLFQDVDYTVDSFAPISMFSFDPEVVAVSSATGIEALEEFFEVAAEQPLTFMTPGHTTANHLAGVLLGERYGLQFTYIHGDSASEVAIQLGGGHVQCSLSPYSSLQSMAEAGKIKILAVCDTKRHPLLPDVPTMEELGYDFTYGTWRGLAAPAGTPDEIVQLLDDTICSIFEDDQVVADFETAGFPITYQDQENFSNYISAEYEDLQCYFSADDFDTALP